MTTDTLLDVSSQKLLRQGLQRLLLLCSIRVQENNAGVNNLKICAELLKKNNFVQNLVVAQAKAFQIVVNAVTNEDVIS